MEPTFSDTPIESPITEFALLILGIREQTVLPIGSGFIIAPYIAITALHVIEGFYSQFCPGRVWHPGSEVKCDFGVFALQYCREPMATVWSVSQVAANSHTDICFLKLIPEDESARSYKFDRRITLNMGAPAVGERVAAFGYPRTAAELLDPKTLRCVLNPKTSAGDVTQVFDEHRDRGMLHFPCFEIRSRFDGGMSGGPVFNSSGHYCGVVCASSGFSSYASTLWPAMGTQLPFETPNLTYTGPYAAIELCAIGVMPSPDWHQYYRRAFEIDRDPFGSTKSRIKLP